MFPDDGSSGLLFRIVGTRGVDRAGLRGLAEGQRIAIVKRRRGGRRFHLHLLIIDAALTRIKARPLSQLSSRLLSQFCAP